MAVYGKGYCPVLLGREVLDGFPSNLIAETISDTIIDLTWNNTTIGEEGINLERRTEESSFTLLQTLNPGTEYFRDSNRLPSTKYYYRAVAFKNGLFSEYSNTVSEWTAMKISLSASGDGTGVGTLRFMSTGNITMNIDGNGKFYDDFNCTINEDTSKVIYPFFTRTFYVKVTSGNSNVLVFAKGNLINIGNTDGWGWEALVNAPSMNMSLLSFCNTLTQLWIFGNNVITGSVADLQNIQVFCCYGSNEITGNISAIPATVGRFVCFGNNTISGNLSGLKSGIYNFECYGINTITGSIASIPSSCALFACQGNNTISGNISDLKSGLTYFDVQGNNTIEGNVENLKSGISIFEVTGYTTITGSITNLPRLLTIFYVTGSNSLYGTIDNLPPNLQMFYVVGVNTISGNIKNIPSTLLQFIIEGNNSITGILSEIPVSIPSIHIRGNNTLSGSFSDLSQYIVYFECSGSNTIKGYTAGKTWSQNMSHLALVPTSGNGLSSSEMDSFLHDTAPLTWYGEKVLWMAGYNAVRTSASDSDVAVLVSKALTLTLN